MNIIKPKAYREADYAACNIPELRELIKTPLGNIDVNPQEQTEFHTKSGNYYLKSSKSRKSVLIIHFFANLFFINPGFSCSERFWSPLFSPFSALLREIVHLFAVHIWSLSTRELFAHGFLTYCSVLRGAHYRGDAGFSRSRLKGESWTSWAHSHSAIVGNRVKNFARMVEEMLDNCKVKGKEDGARKVKYVRRFKRNRGIAADCWRKYDVLWPASLEKAKAGASGPDTYIKIAVPFSQRTTFLPANTFYRRVLLAREGRAESNRVRGRGSRKIGAKRMRME